MEPISKYFNEEKYESVFFVLVGVIAIVLSIYFFAKVKTPFYNGVSYALIAIAAIQLTVGISVYFRSPKDILRVESFVKHQKFRILVEEIPRMKVVMKNFVFYRWIQISLIVVGLIFYFYFDKETMMKGLGIGLFIQSALMLFLDYFAEKRGFEYLDYLSKLN
jgi:lipoprotein signal peptidase